MIAAIRLLLFTGCRYGEVVNLRWDQVDFANRAIRLPDTKTGPASVYLSEPAMALLRDRPRIEGNPYVFPGRREGRPLVGLPKIWQRLRRRVGLPELRLHDLRHSFASFALATEKNLPLVGKLLNHRDLKTTQGYAHLETAAVAAASERVGRVIDAGLRGGADVVPLSPEAARG